MTNVKDILKNKIINMSKMDSSNRSSTEESNINAELDKYFNLKLIQYLKTKKYDSEVVESQITWNDGTIEFSFTVQTSDGNQGRLTKVYDYMTQLFPRSSKTLIYDEELSTPLVTIIRFISLELHKLMKGTKESPYA